MLSYKHLKVTAAALALPITLAACGGGSSTGSSSNSSTNSSTSSTSSSTSASSGEAMSGTPSPEALRAAGAKGYLTKKSVHLTITKLVVGKTTTADAEADGSIDGSQLQTKVTYDNGGSFIYRLVDGKSYLNGDLKYYTLESKVPEARARKVAGRWVQIPQSAATKQVEEYFGPCAWLKQAFAATGGAIKPTATIKRETVDGAEQFSVTNPTKSHMQLTTSDPILPISIEASAGKSGKFTFSKWDAPLNIEAPANPMQPLTPSDASSSNASSSVSPTSS